KAACSTFGKAAGGLRAGYTTVPGRYGESCPYVRPDGAARGGVDRSARMASRGSRGSVERFSGKLPQPWSAGYLAQVLRLRASHEQPEPRCGAPLLRGQSPSIPGGESRRRYGGTDYRLLRAPPEGKPQTDRALPFSRLRCSRRFAGGRPG